MTARIGRPPTRRRMVATFCRSAAASISSHGSNDESRTGVAAGAAAADKPDSAGIAAAARRNARRDVMGEPALPRQLRVDCLSLPDPFERLGQRLHLDGAIAVAGVAREHELVLV